MGVKRGGLTGINTGRRNRGFLTHRGEGGPGMSDLQGLDQEIVL
jgi:hypothetical protein